MKCTCSWERHANYCISLFCWSQVNLRVENVSCRHCWDVVPNSNSINVDQAITELFWVFPLQVTHKLPVTSSTGIVPVKPSGPLDAHCPGSNQKQNKLRWVIAMLTCGWHFCQNFIFATEIQNERTIILPETHKELVLNDHNRSVTLRVFKCHLYTQS